MGWWLRIGVGRLAAGLVPAGCMLALVACGSSDGGDSGGAAGAGSERVERANAGCADGRGALLGDVDGDGLRDRVTLTVAGRDRRRCRFVLRVRSARREHATRVRGRFAAGEQHVPRLVTLVRIAPGPQRQVVVDVRHGASTLVADVYRVSDGRLRRVQIADIARAGGGSLRDGFPYRGSLAISFAIDCAAGPGGGTVLATTLSSDARDRRVIRWTGLRLSSLRFERAPHLDRRYAVPNHAMLDASRDTPFTSCR